MRNCILGGDNFRAFRVDLGGQNSKGDNFQLYRKKFWCKICKLPLQLAKDARKSASEKDLPVIGQLKGKVEIVPF